MARPLLIAIGPFRELDVQIMNAEFDLRHLRSCRELVDLKDKDRQAAQAVAYFGHDMIAGPDMDLLPDLRLIAHFGAGYDPVDVAAASARSIQVTNTPGVLNDDVADLAVALYVMQARELVTGDAWVRQGNWEAKGSMPLARSASNRRVGICGLGRIGREIANRLAAMKCDVHYSSRAPKDVPANWTYHADAVSLAGAVDALFVALVGGPETEGLVSGEVIDALGPEGVLVNIARGSTIDEAALLDALETGRLQGAALDVFLSEPEVDERFRALENVVLCPHLGSATEQTRAAMGQLQRDNLAAFFAGNALLTPVN